MIFTYWSGEAAATAPFRTAWSPIEPRITVYGDDDVAQILRALDPAYEEIYRRIRIPACRSDVARIALLYRHGGFYIDTHGGPGDPGAWHDLKLASRSFEIILFDEPLNHKREGDVHILTGALAGQRQSPLLRMLLAGIFGNLERQLRAEAASMDHVPYNIFVLSGPWEVRLRLVTVQPPFAVRPELRESVLLHRLDLDLRRRPFLWYVNYGYRRAGQHWSERQQTEPLFAP
jgi:hypothetical protein